MKVVYLQCTDNISGAFLSPASMGIRAEDQDVERLGVLRGRPSGASEGLKTGLEDSSPVGVVSLQPAAKYQRPAWRPSPGQTAPPIRPSWRHSNPLHREDALDAGCAGARRHLRSPPVAVSHHH